MRIVCVADSVARSLVADGVPFEKLAVVPNGVPVEGLLDRDAARLELGLEVARPAIGMVAHLRPEKRHELALHGLAVLRERRPDVVLCVVGDGPRRDELLRLAQELGLGDSIVWAGERRDAHRLHPAFDVTLLCSTFEGMPLAALESLVAGVPVVSTAVGAMPELLRDGNGAIVDPEPVALAAGIESVLVQGADQASERRHRNLGRYGIDRMARELECIYDSVLESTRT
jgi:glycosyltransferase involved in cell wall biosynthesis